MQCTINKSLSDDEDDLESLRLAALQSLKRHVQPVVNGSTPVQNKPRPPCNNKFGGVKNLKRGRGFHGVGRPSRNGSYNNRMRNTNLISVQTIEPVPPEDNKMPDLNLSKKFTEDIVPKLVLPQDRYCNTKTNTESKTNEVTSKFDRYNDSDSESDSDSEEETVSETESSKKLERSNSLEALMQELEDEIQGEIKLAKPIMDNACKPKKIKKCRKSKQSETTSDVLLLELVEDTNKEKKNDDNSCDNPVIKSPVRQRSKSPLKNMDIPPNARKSLEKPSLTNNCVPQNLLTDPQLSITTTASVPFNSNVNVAPQAIPFQQASYTNFNPSLGHMAPYDPSLSYNFPPTAPAPPMGILSNIHSPPAKVFSPNRYERPISPLTINTDILNTISAPLSPRSAAFVLQNREIVERRKKSPKRSYSRSPSPQFRRSMSPRYRRSNSRTSLSPSPVRTSRRQSPIRKVSPNRKLSPNVWRTSPSSQTSSRRTSPRYNRRRLTPPKRSSPGLRTSPKRSRMSPQRSNVRNRLGNLQQPDKHDTTVLPSENNEERISRKRSRSISLSLSPSPERFSGNKEDNKFDAVLEARKRKFEGNGNVPTEGIIRLKPKVGTDETPSSSKENDESHQMDEEDLNEDNILGEDDTIIDFNVKVDDLFSDEESDEENEGRFKSNRQQQASGNVTAVPFTHLTNGSTKGSKSESVSRDVHSWNKERRERSYFSRSDRNRSSARNKSTDRRDRERSRIRMTSAPRNRSPLGAQNCDIAEEKKFNKSSALVKGLTKLSTENVERSTTQKRNTKTNLSLRADSKSDRRRQPIVSPIENKKIEIKIRNPSKYEVDNENNKGQIKDKKVSSRKVEVANGSLINDNDKEFDEPEPEIIIENEEREDDDEDVINNTSKDTGDLRAQLSRKRAERQNKLPKMEGVSSRLLQNALQGAVFKKSKKSKKKSKEAPIDGDVDTSVYAAIKRTTAKLGYGNTDINCSTARKDRKVRVLHCDAEPLTTISDGKLPIHLRLGVPGNADIFSDSKSYKIPRKRTKNRGTFNQV